ncbi:ATP-binding protein [Microbispora sp. H10830]|uniref:ATP-binding protein n=1 Tax=Microbispora sp. H10830 TaxID=2729109 RepID=UPI0016012328|nr:ATP-binding protein [Microbispora sp. H10830]
MTPWPQVGRTEQTAQLTSALDRPASGPVVISGAPGTGRTSMLRLAVTLAERHGYLVLRLRPRGTGAMAALRGVLPPGPVPAPEEAARTLRMLAGGRRFMVVLDDAHLADHETLLTLRALNRSHTTALVVSRTAITRGEDDPAPRPDPTDCLMYERGLVHLVLPPLGPRDVAELFTRLVGGPVRQATAAALHTLTGGVPRRLHELADAGLVRCLAERRGRWEMTEPGPLDPALPREAADAAAAARRAWACLGLDQAEELCRVALWQRAEADVADVWAVVLLLRGRGKEAAAFLDSLPPSAAADGDDAEPARLTFARALVTAFGLGKPSEAADLLLLRALAARPDRDSRRDRHLAQRAWILAATGAAEPEANLDRGDRETALFVHAAQAALAADRPQQAVLHLRRALAVSEGCHVESAWLPAYLRGELTGALARAGRPVSAAAADRAQEPVGAAVAAMLRGARATAGPDLREAAAAVPNGAETGRSRTARTPARDEVPAR